MVCTAINSYRTGVDLLQAQKWSYQDCVPAGFDNMRLLLQRYSKIAPGDVDNHLLRIRERAWKVSHKPFIGRWRFLRMDDASDPFYQQVCFRLKLPRSQDILVDLGCGLGQSIRQLRQDGVDPRRLMAADMERRFIDVGYDLFRDSSTLGVEFLVGNLLDPDDQSLNSLIGKATIIHMDSLFHLFTRNEQLFAGQRIVTFLQPGTRNGLIYGRQAGTIDTTLRSARRESGLFLHNENTMQELWDDIGQLTGTRWHVQIEYDGDPDAAAWGLAKGAVPVKFAIHQVS